MSKRWPNTDHWQRTWEALDRLAGSRRRRYGEELFGLPRGGLRAHIDRHDIPHEELVRIEDLIAAAFRVVIEDWRQGLEQIEIDAREFDDKSAARRFEVRQAARRVYDDECLDLVMQAYAWTFRHNDEQEAA